jgi:PKHD-type hydroxylase
MAQYSFLPSPTFGVSELPFATWRGGFTDEELNKIVECGDALEKQKAFVGGSSIDDDISNIRESQISWIQMSNDTMWIYDRLAYIARQLNGQFYKFNLYGFNEEIQYTTYNADTEGHYTWHVDAGPSNAGAPPRKFSIVVQLSDPNDYEGGDLEIFTSANPTQVDKERGIVAAFPSYTLHRVTPVTKGIRKSLVIWVTGPAFV